MIPEWDLVRRGDLPFGMKAATRDGTCSKSRQKGLSLGGCREQGTREQVLDFRIWKKLEEKENERSEGVGRGEKKNRGRCRWRGDFSREELARGRRSAGMVSIQLDLFASIPFCYDFWVCQFVFLLFILMYECEHCGFYHVLGCSWMF